MQKIITIIGGQGQMGKLFSRLWQSQEYLVRSLDKDDWSNAQQLLADCNLAVVCVPIHRTEEVISQITPYLPEHAILADFTSIKATPLQFMLKQHIGPVLGLHPMFGPSISSPQNQVIIECGGRSNYDWVLESLSHIGFTIVHMGANEHDLIMSFIQGIEHFSTFVLGSFLRQHQQHPQGLFNLASPIYQAKLTLMGRIFDQDAKLYADIITADNKRIKLIEEYVHYLQNWISKLANPEEGAKEFIDEFNQTKEWMGEFTHLAQLSSDNFLTAVSNSFVQNDTISSDIK